jgi:carbon starvation protein
MNSAYLILTALCFFALAYRYYGAFIATKVLMLNDAYQTPAYRCNDGREFVPTNPWILWGHHFAAIAGAGPLVGPVLAAQYGWGPGFFWILLGAVFAGAVHDFIALFASVRHNGQSLSIIARREVSPLTGVATSFAILFIIIIALAGLAIVVVSAMFKNPWGTYTLFATIPIAMAVGLLMHLVPGTIRLGSIIGCLLVLGAVFTGHYIPNSSWAGTFTLTKEQLSIILPFYGFCSAVLPVWLLLSPRDYLSSYMKIGTIAALALGIFIVQPTVNFPFMSGFADGGGPIIPGPWWPYVFITIACGAISGFHSLIASGTTPKMVQLESQTKTIAFGAMLVEGIVAVMALISAVVLMPGDFFMINTLAPAYDKAALLFPDLMKTVNIDQLQTLVGIDIHHRPGGAVSLAVSMAYIFSSIGGLSHLMGYWYQFAIMFEALFILTTIDTGTRVARYILQDVIGTYIWAPMKRTYWWPGIFMCSTSVTVCWGYLLYSGDVASIWPMFGVANQLLAIVALALGVTIILKIGQKKSYALIPFVPMVFLTITVITAGIMNTSMYFKLTGAQATLGKINGTVSVIMMGLVFIVLIDSSRLWLKLLKKEKPVGMNTEIDHVCLYGQADEAARL